MTPAGKDPWLESEPELSARLLRPMLRFYEKRWGRSSLEQFASRMGTTLEVLQDKDRWFSVERFLAFIRAMAADTGDPDIAYKAGRAFVEPGIIGVEGYLIRALLTPRAVYEQAAVISARTPGASRAARQSRPSSRAWGAGLGTCRAWRRSP